MLDVVGVSTDCRFALWCGQTHKELDSGLLWIAFSTQDNNSDVYSFYKWCCVVSDRGQALKTHSWPLGDRGPVSYTGFVCAAITIQCLLIYATFASLTTPFYYTKVEYYNSAERLV